MALSAGGWHTVGLKTDGTVVAAGDNNYGQCNVSDWTDIVAISAGWYCTVGLKADGTVVFTGNYMSNISDWTDIVAIDVYIQDVVGLKADGTVVCSRIYYGWGDGSQCDVSNWTGIRVPGTIS